MHGLPPAAGLRRKPGALRTTPGVWQWFLAKQAATRATISPWHSPRAADTRILAANVLYTELIALCGVGKALYATTDARKYQDYVVTETPAPAVAPVPPVA